MANPTSAFGWQMPTNTDLVKDLPADFEVFGQAVDDSFADLKGGTTGQVLSKASNTDLDFTWTTPTDQTPLTTKGDLFTFDTADARLSVGTNGQVLKANSSTATGLEWGDASNKVVQIVYGSTTTATSSSSSTYADTNLSATITPTSASNNILVLVSQNSLQRTAANAAAGIAIRLFRGATNIAQILSEGAYTNSTLVQNIGSASIMLLDSPATTSATTYKTQFANDGNAGSVTVQFGSCRSTIVLMEVTP